MYSTFLTLLVLSMLGLAVYVALVAANLWVEWSPYTSCVCLVPQPPDPDNPAHKVIGGARQIIEGLAALLPSIKW